MNNKNDLSRREFLKRLGIGTLSAASLMGLEPLSAIAREFDEKPKIPAEGDGDIRMTYRVNRHSGDKVSLLGYGMMRLPQKDRKIDQDMVNQEVDYAIAHGINYFDTAPVYHGGQSEVATGIALSRHPRDKYMIATKMSNQSQNMWDFDKAKEMYENSFKKLQVDYIDYYLLHSIGGGGVENLKGRFIDNGLLEFLLEERKAGRIRNLGFSYHGDVEAFDWLLDRNDEYKWDFVQIELNYLDWRHASTKGGWKHDADAEYLYNKLEKLGIQAVVMEPLLGGRLAKVPEEIADQLKAERAEATPASWAFRWVGTLPNILVALSGMTSMEVLEENVKTFSPLDPCTDKEKELLERIADQMAGFPVVPCTACSYCMPCPYGVDIPGNFGYYNNAVNEKLLPLPSKDSPDYAERLQKYQQGYEQTLKTENWATKCMDCEECLPKCPQQIRIPNQLARVAELLNKP